MSSLSSALKGAGVLAGTYGAAASLIGTIGLLVSTPTFCPRHPVDAQLCRNAFKSAANLAVYGLIGAGAAGLMLAASRAIDPEA